MATRKHPCGTGNKYERETEIAAKELVDATLECITDFLLMQLTRDINPRILVTRRATIISPSGRDFSAAIFLTDHTTAALFDEFLKAHGIHLSRKA